MFRLISVRLMNLFKLQMDFGKKKSKKVLVAKAAWGRVGRTPLLSSSGQLKEFWGVKLNTFCGGPRWGKNWRYSRVSGKDFISSQF